ncbi:MAG TPA: bifunctional diaminohydroxyphosphoribosylaminopyrimidine deaminase/5-amino-6-(5-phosphoribosylamino)uracil reductase RibD [Alphaproteobacteria bacterium]|nr:bifunctional diaminohydroxyphosphoribosylaminopyrimidine deaminase/5-amino-6-(5-phosphoribosylamino)uracil reductase RibD [Alphaproteobacteria bacterium]
MMKSYDIGFMRGALMLARRNLGNTWPNPSVGCVLVRDDLAAEPAIVGRGWTERGGRPHAETQAIARAGELACGATAYVTLEPCSHHGQTPPCADALIKAGIKRAVVALVDPDRRVAGHGVEMLRAAGIEVEVGVESAAARAIGLGHIKRVTQGLPMVTLKLATTLDGRIATHIGESKWISGGRARAEAHRLRAEHDAILIGSETAVRDNPMLTCRLPGLDDRSPVRVVADGRLRLPLTSAIASSAREVPTWLITVPGNLHARLQAFADCGIDIVEVPIGDGGSPDARAMLGVLAARGITRVLAEGGARLAAALVQDDLIDELRWFRAASVIGGDGRPAIDAFGLETMAEIRRFSRTSVRPVGEDVVETYVRES